MADPSETEIFLFGSRSLNALDYYTTVASATGLPKKGFYVIKEHAEDPSTAGHCVCFYHGYDDSDVCLFFSYGLPGKIIPPKLLSEGAHG